MKFMITLITLVILSLFSTGVFAQSLEDRLKALEDNLGKQDQVIRELKATQETVRKQEQTIDEQRKLIEELKVEMKQGRSSAPAEGATAEQAAPAGEMQQQVEELKEKVDQVVEAQTQDLPEHIQSRHRGRGRDDLLLSQQEIIGDGERPARRV